jgi:hypothetical protein
MARTISTIGVVGGQSFNVTINGLNVRTNLSVYFDTKKVPATSLQPRAGKLGDPIITDGNGRVEFIYFLDQPTSDFVNIPEASFIDIINKDSGIKNLVVVDSASINTSTLPDNYSAICRCYAVKQIDKAFTVNFTEVKDWGDQTAFAGGSTVTYASSPTSWVAGATNVVFDPSRYNTGG